MLSFRAIRWMPSKNGHYDGPVNALSPAYPPALLTTDPRKSRLSSEISGRDAKSGNQHRDGVRLPGSPLGTKASKKKDNHQQQLWPVSLQYAGRLHLKPNRTSPFLDPICKAQTHEAGLLLPGPFPRVDADGQARRYRYLYL
jgi:hypothetical protein